MCGILLVKSTYSIDINQHERALELLKNRGPDLVKWRYKNNIFIGQTVLHVTGSIDVYNESSDDFFAFNGELYNYKTFGNYSSDTQLAKQTVRSQQWNKLKEWHGPWSWVWTDFNNIFCATDPQYEKHLFMYKDDDLLIISSELAPIFCYVSHKLTKQQWQTKHWPILDQTPWKHITRISAGSLYTNGSLSESIDNMSEWTDNFTGTFDESVEELDFILGQVCTDMMPEEPATLSYSGGLDSSLIRAYMPQLTTLSLDILNKDPIAKEVTSDLKISVDYQQWAKSYKRTVDYTLLPLCSWNWASYGIVAEHSQSRIIFSGNGADELFGGYPYHLSNQPSPYSLAWENSFLADYIIQQGGVDLLGADLVSGMYGKESRTPFTHQRVIKFALSLPRSFKVTDKPKAILHALYKKKTNKTMPVDKQGFAGHCNDCIELIWPDYQRRLSDRAAEWKDFIQQDFYRRHVS